MSELDIIRAWKDKTYRNSLSAEQLARLPEHPAGTIELTDDELTDVDGGTTGTVSIAVSVSVVMTIYLSYRYCPGITFVSLCPCVY